jgi:hypothetical protein
MKLALLAVGYVVGLFAVAALSLTVREWLVRRPPPSPEEQQAAEAAWRARLLAPDWPAVERQLTRRAPQVLHRLYADHALLLSAPLTVTGPPDAIDNEWYIESFHPADGSDHFWVPAPAGAFCFATTGFGDPYYVELEPRGDDGPVFVHYHDGGDIVRIADTLAEFLAWPRRPDRPHRDAEA